MSPKLRRWSTWPPRNSTGRILAGQRGGKPEDRILQNLAGREEASPLDVAKSMPGWTIVASDVDAGRIEASQQSRIRVVGEAGSRIDMRSTSRQGLSDYGVNAARIRAYMSALRERIG
jgi:uncharacterized protein (DUF1499 family)